MRKIACVTIHEYYSSYEDPTEYIVSNITAFEEVDDETFDNLVKASQDWEVRNKLGHQFYVIEQHDYEFTRNTLATYLRVAQQRIEQLAKEKAERERKAAQAKEKKAAKALLKKTERIAMLQAELAQLAQEEA